VAAFAAPPAGDPDGQHQHSLVDDRSQTAATHIMWGERAARLAPRAKLSITGTFGTAAAHQMIVALDLSFSAA